MCAAQEGSVVWMSDKSSDFCMSCGDEFSMINRRHHCRGCGRLLCKVCSDYTAVLPFSSGKAVRVCSLCFYSEKLKANGATAESGGNSPSDLEARVQEPQFIPAPSVERPDSAAAPQAAAISSPGTAPSGAPAGAVLVFPMPPKQAAQ